MRRIFASAVMLLAISSTAVWAGQNVVIKRGKGASTGMITGVVLGPDDKPAPHAAISYQSSSGSMPHAVHADAHGRFTILKLQTDNYDVRASANGIFSVWEKNLPVQNGHTSELTLRLIYAREMPKSKSTKKN
jgi:Carboxypeptidase regulatory-like domain